MNLFTLADGRRAFHQWDTGRQLIVHDTTCNEVHFCNGSGEGSLVCPVKDLDDLRVVDVPNILLQQTLSITAFAFVEEETGGYTRRAVVFPVRPRPKPEDYVYTEEERLTWQALDERITALEDAGVPEGGGSGTVTDEQVAKAVERYLDENPVQPGATAEQAAQIQANKEAIEQLQNGQNSGGNVNGGMSTTAKNLLITILLNSVYTNDQSANIVALKNALNASSGSDSGSGDDSGDSGDDTGGDAGGDDTGGAGGITVYNLPGWTLTTSINRYKPYKEPTGIGFSAYFKCDQNTTYRVVEKGTHNRFTFIGFEDPDWTYDNGATGTTIASTATNPDQHSLMEYTFDSGEFNWIYVYLSADNTVSPNITVEIVEEDETVGFGEVVEAPGWCVNGSSPNVVMWDEANTYSAYFKCKPNTTYKITENGTHNRFSFYGVTTKKIELKRNNPLSVIADSTTNPGIANLTEFTISSGEYKWIYVYLAGSGGVSPNISVEEVA